MIEFRCSNCGQRIGISDFHAGKMVGCPKCGETTQVPQAAEASVGAETGLIKFRCPGCNQKIGVPVSYAGKALRCKKCGKAVRIPFFSEDVSEDKPRTIKFRCPHCGQKIGVGQEHAGKRVRCAKCRKPLRIPGQKQEKAAEAASKVEAGDGAAYGDKIWSDALLSTAAAAESSVEAQEELRIGPPVALGQTGPQKKCPACGASNRADTEFCTTCGETIRLESGYVSGALGTAAKIPLALGASFGFTLGGAIAWAIIVCLVGLRWVNFLSVVVAGLAGAGLTIFTEKRSAWLGLLAAFIGFVGIICGKVCIAKWAVLPEMEQAISSADWEEVKLSDKEVEWRLREPNNVFRAACFQMAEEGEFDKEFARKVVATHYDGRAPLGEAEQVKAGIDKVEQRLTGWSDEEKRAAIQAQHARDVKAFKEFGKALVGAMAESAEEEEDVPAAVRRTAREANDLMRGQKKLGETRIGFFFALLGSFRFLDLLFFPMGLWSAYKIGAGRE